MEPLPEEQVEQVSGSDVRDFYRGKCIFITGGIGFIGKVLIDSIVRKCPDIDSIYVLIRGKKGKTAHERLLETLKSKIFHGLSESVLSKIHSLDGNVETPGLGLSMEDSLLLKAKAQIVIHCAANVRFDEKIRVSLRTNLLGTINFLDLCREMTKVESILYVSTAFSNSNRDDVDEKFYKPPIDIESALTIIDYPDDYVLRILEPLLLSNWPNIYAFSKAITENLIKERSQGLPIGVYRPSIVLGTSYQHHLPGFIDNVYGPTALFIGIGLGAFRVLHMDVESPANLVPADLCANGIIASTWHVAKYRYEEPIIFNFVLDDNNKVTWSGISVQSMERLRNQPIDVQIWYPDYNNIPNYYVFVYYHYLLHVLPGVIIDTILYLRGDKPKLLKLYRKLEVFLVFLERYYKTYWSFGQKNIKTLFNSLSSEEKKIFNFDMASFNWLNNCDPMVDGIKKYVVLAPAGVSKNAIKKIKIFKICHYTIKIAYYLFLFYFVTRIINYASGNYFTKAMEMY